MGKIVESIFITVSLIVIGVGIGAFMSNSNSFEDVVEVEEMSVEDVNSFGRFAVLEKQGEYQDEYSNLHEQYLVYDEATYIIYIYDASANGTAISPYYCMNSENKPEIAVYWDGMDLE